MNPFRTAVVIGKFYPPHRGHKLLIDRALSQSDRVTAIVCDEPGQTIPGERRAAWLRTIHPGIEVLLVRSPLAADDTAGWAASTMEWLGAAPDAVFTSEAYGDAYARLMGATHVMVDANRVRVPVSGTAVRQRPLDHLAFLEPCVRAHFVKRVVVVGAESTGTTTLARSLAAHYQTVWVPELGRLYWEGRQHHREPWQSDEFTAIAAQQAALEDALAPLANRVLICDTDPFATTIWHERYVGTVSGAVSAIAAGRHCDLYLLTTPEVPFVQDGTRDGEGIREWMHGRFLEELRAGATPFRVVAGSHRDRMTLAVGMIDGLLAGR